MPSAAVPTIRQLLPNQFKPTGSPIFERDPVLRRELLIAIEQGVPWPIACVKLGVSRTTFAKYLSLGEQGIEPYFTFMLEVEEARAQVIVKNLDLIQAHASKDWKAAEKMLNITAPEVFNKENNSGNGPGGVKLSKKQWSDGTVETSVSGVDISSLTVEQLRALVQPPENLVSREEAVATLEDEEVFEEGEYENLNEDEIPTEEDWLDEGDEYGFEIVDDEQEQDD